jgi:hypothetical protein
MATNEPAEPTVEEADRRAERAKASLLARVEVLKHKLSDAKLKVDVRSQIVKHPLPAAGIAFALGMLAGLRRTHTAGPTGTATSHPVASAVAAGIAALGLRVVRELALGQLGKMAKEWLDQPGSDAEGGKGGGAGLRD